MFLEMDGQSYLEKGDIIDSYKIKHKLAMP